MRGRDPRPVLPGAVATVSCRTHCWKGWMFGRRAQVEAARFLPFENWTPKIVAKESERRWQGVRRSRTHTWRFPGPRPLSPAFRIPGRVECLDVASTSKPPIFLSSSRGPMRLSPKKKRKGGKKREEAGPALGALGSRESCLLSLSWTHNSELRTSRSCRSRPSFTPIRSRPRKLLPGKVRGGGRLCAEAGLTPGVLGGRAGSPLYHSSLGRLVFCTSCLR